jgi:hypothetical protein
VIVKETENEQEIRTILCNKEIYDTISDDYSPQADDFTLPFDGYRYIGGYVNDEIIAVMVYHAYRDGNKCHVQVLPQFRESHAAQFGEQSLLFKGTQPLYAEIPDLYGNVLDFAHKFGFKIIETVKNDYIKNGIGYNMNILEL